MSNVDGTQCRCWCRICVGQQWRCKRVVRNHIIRYGSTFGGETIDEISQNQVQDTGMTYA